MTTFPLFLNPITPSQADLNAFINSLNALLPNIAVSGDQAISGNLAVTGTTALTGNASASGTLGVTGLATLNGGIAGGSSANIAINTNKFTVAASSGNTLIAGTLAVTGASTLTGAVAITGNLTTAAYTLRSTANALTAIGANRAGALALAKDINRVTTTGSGTGVVLPAGVVGMHLTVFNADGANVLQVYANGSDTIDGIAGSTGVQLSSNSGATYTCVAANTFVSNELGGTSN